MEGKRSKFNTTFGIVAATHDYGKTIGWTIKEGRDFSRSFPTDSGALILNESAARLTGMKDPVGQIIKWNDKERPVLAVVKDMVMESPYTPVKPTIFFLEYGWASVITMRIKPDSNYRDALTELNR
jgi:hypothetical protein